MAAIAVIPAQALSQASPTTIPPPAYTPTLTFDVASIREKQRTSPMTISFEDPPNNSKFHYTNVWGWQLITSAYGIDDFKLSGEPVWLKNTLYDVNAKSDSATDDLLAKLPSRDGRLEKQHMLQMLLADRFHLKVHWETKELPAYALSVAKGSTKLQDAKAPPPTPEELKHWGDNPIPPLYQRGDGRRGVEFIAHGAQIESIVSILSVNLHQTIFDRTGLTGKYDFLLQYHGTVNYGYTEEPGVWPPLEFAIEDQLGLKLEPTKGPVPVLVIDHIEKPSEN
jgi:uncharacterized protein (TIGR03435 family)